MCDNKIQAAWRYKDETEVEDEIEVNCCFNEKYQLQLVLAAGWTGTDHLLLPSDCFKDYSGECRAYDAGQILFACVSKVICVGLWPDNKSIINYWPTTINLRINWLIDISLYFGHNQ